MKPHALVLTLIFFTFLGEARSEHEVALTKMVTVGSTSTQILQGKVDLPPDGLWVASHVYEERDGLIEVYLSPEEDRRPQGRRAGKLQDLRDKRARMYRLSYLFSLAQSYAREHDGMGPAHWDAVIAAFPDRDLDEGRFGDTRVVPGVRLFHREDDGWRMPKEAEPVIFDTRPAVDDGLHWVVDSRGRRERQPIDQALMRSLQVTIQAARKPFDADDASATAPIPHTITARLTGQPGLAAIPIRDVASGETATVAWDFSEPAPGGENIGRTWARQRQDHLAAISGTASMPLVNATWASITRRQYLSEAHEAPPAPANRGRTAGAMNVLGGRAAIQETLQMQALQVDGAAPDDAAPVSVETIPGVEIQAHPFESLLASQAGGRLALADWVPNDRFMAYLPKTEGLFSLLQGGSEFIFRAGSTLAGRTAAHRLKERYLSALGLSETLMEQFLKTGALEEMALVLPDLFLIDGTEISVVARTGKPLLTTTALALVGIAPGDGTTVKRNARGENVYWHRQGAVLVISTDKGELEAILAAKASGGGLGQSAELRYMLTQVPVSEETAAYLYFSDPFIRHLVSPRTKIAQLRRMRARTDLERATAGSLLATFDGHQNRATDLGFLRESGYLAEPIIARDLAIEPNGRSRSATFGSAPRLRSLTDQTVDLVAPEEHRAYEQYLEEYNRYWRQFFDPIAIRYEKKANGRHAVETFILPLIDNSLYTGLREFLPSESDHLELFTPIMTPEPIAMISFNLREEAWLELLENVSPQIDQFLGLDTSLLDLLGPDIHLAIQDGDPILSMGNGEIDGFLGRFGGRPRSDMFVLPALISVLTRPCTIHLGLQEPEAVREKLLEMALRTDPAADGRRNSFGTTAFYKVTGEERWILKYAIEDLITLRFGIEVQDRYLVINNMPFSHAVNVTGSERAPNQSAYLQLNLGACVQQLASLHASAAEANRQNALSGAGALLPLMVTGSADVGSAQQRHLALFGFEPLHPAGGTWRWENSELVSSLYGSVWRRQQPAFRPETSEMGMLRKVARLSLSMQFEEDGLRSTVSWRLK